MNRYQKLAWLNLIVITSTIIITSTAIAVEIYIRGYSTIGFWFIGILVILKFNRFLFKKPQGQDQVVCDERDSLIIKRACPKLILKYFTINKTAAKYILRKSKFDTKKTNTTVVIKRNIFTAGCKIEILLFPRVVLKNILFPYFI